MIFLLLDILSGFELKSQSVLASLIDLVAPVVHRRNHVPGNSSNRRTTILIKTDREQPATITLAIIIKRAIIINAITMCSRKMQHRYFGTR